MYSRPGQVSAVAGFTQRAVTALNHAQTDYHRFVMVPTAIKRRFADFEQGRRLTWRFFENLNWGWQRKFSMLPGYASGKTGGILVARASKGADQGYFDTLNGKRLALYHGYNYAFAEFNPDPEYLSKPSTPP